MKSSPASPPRNERDTTSLLAPLRAHLLKRILQVILIVGPVAVVTGAVAAVLFGAPLVMWANTISYLMVVALYLIRDRAPRVAACATSLVGVVVGTYLVLMVGLESAAMIWLLVPVALAALLLGNRAAISLLLLTLLVLAVTTVLMLRGALPWDTTLYGWIAVLASYVSVSVVLILPVRAVVYRLAQGLLEEQRLNDEANRLLREVHHRVKNNLQVLASLISLHSGGRDPADPLSSDDTLEMVRRWIVTMGHTYAGLAPEDRQLRVDVRAVLEVVAEDFRGRDGHARFSIPDDCRLSLTIDAAVPLTILCAELTAWAVHATAAPIRVVAQSMPFALSVVSDAATGAPEPRTGVRQILELLATQADARLEILPLAGTLARITVRDRDTGGAG